MLKQKQRASGRNCAGEGSDPMKITVYLGASEGNDPALKTAVQELELLHKTNYIDARQYKILSDKCATLRVMLVSSCRTAKSNIDNK